MDIEFIEEQDREGVLQLMQICGIDMSQAYQLYNNANKNIQAATKMYFNQSPQTNQRPTQFIPPSIPTQYTQQPIPYYDNQQDLDDFDIKFIKYKQFLMAGTTFQNNYQLRKPKGMFDNFVNKLLKTNQQKHYKQKLQQHFNHICSIKFKTQSLSMAFYKSQKFPIIVYLFDFTSPLKNKFQQILYNPQFQHIVNIQFHNFGLDQNYQLEPSLKPIINPSINKNSLMIFRVNIFQQIQHILTIPIYQNITVSQIKQKLKLAKSQCINQQLQQGYLVQRNRQQFNGNFNYVKPVPPAQKARIRQQRKLRQQQQKQFYSSLQAANVKSQNKQSQEKLTYKKQSQPQSKLQHNPKQKQPPKPILSKRNMAEQRKKIRDHLKIYTEGMAIKFRFPNGQSQVLTVSKQQTPAYLFNYIKSIDKDIGFQHDEDRKFVIIRPYDRLTLNANQNKTLDKIFQGSDGQNLVINEQTNA